MPAEASASLRREDTPEWIGDADNTCAGVGTPLETLHCTAEASPSASWVHQVVWCTRPDDGGRVCVHLFTPHATAEKEATRRRRTLEELACNAWDSSRTAAGIDDSASASNVGGHHSARNLFSDEAVIASGLPTALHDAVHHAAAVEAAALGRVPLV